MKETVKEITQDELDMLMDRILDKMNAHIPLSYLEDEFLKNPNDQALARTLTQLKEIPIIPDDELPTGTDIGGGDFTFPNAIRDSQPDAEYTVALMTPLRDIYACSMGCQMRNEPFYHGCDYIMIIRNIEGRAEFSLTEEESGFFVLYKSIHKLFADWNIIEIIETKTK